MGRKMKVGQSVTGDRKAHYAFSTLPSCILVRQAVLALLLGFACCALLVFFPFLTSFPFFHLYLVILGVFPLGTF